MPMSASTTRRLRKRRCGNGMRLRCRLLFKETGQERLTLETGAGLLTFWKGDRPLISTVDMGKPRFAWNEIPLAKQIEDTPRHRAADWSGSTSRSCIHLPSSSWVIPRDLLVDEVWPATTLPNRTAIGEPSDLSGAANISVAQVASREHSRRPHMGAGAALTKACGSAACASAVAAARLGLVERTVTVALPGGELRIEWRVERRPCG